MKKSILLIPLVGFLLAGCSLFGGDDDKKNEIKNFKYDPTSHLLSWDNDNKYTYYELKINDKQIFDGVFAYEDNSGTTQLPRQKLTTNSYFFSPKKLKNTISLRTYDSSTNEFGSWNTINYDVSKEKLTVPLVEIFLNATQLNGSLYGKLESVLFASLVIDDNEQYVYNAAIYNNSVSYGRISLEKTYPSLLSVIQDYFVSEDNSVFWNYNYFKDNYKVDTKHDFLSTYLSLDDYKDTTLNELKDAGYTFTPVKSATFACPRVYSHYSDIVGTEAILQAKKENDIYYYGLSVEMSYSYHASSTMEHAFSKSAMEELLYSSDVESYLLEGDCVDLAMMKEYDDPTGKQTPFYESKLTSDDGGHYRKNNNPNLLNYRLNYEAHSYSDWSLDNHDKHQKDRTCDKCHYLDTKKLDSMELFNFYNINDEYWRIEFKIEEQVFKDYPFESLIIPDIYQGRPIGEIRDHYSDGVDLIKNQIKEIIIGKNVVEIYSSFLTGFPNLNKLELPSGLASSSFPTKLDNIPYNTWKNGNYYGNEENPYLIYCGTTETEPTEIYVHPNTQMINIKAFANQKNLATLHLPFMGISPRHMFSLATYQNYYHWSYNELYDNGRVLRNFEIYDNTPMTFFYWPELNRYYGVDYLKLGTGVRGLEIYTAAGHYNDPKIFLPNTMINASNNRFKLYSYAGVQYDGTMNEFLKLRFVIEHPSTSSTNPMEIMYVKCSDGYITYSYRDIDTSTETSYNTHPNS